MIKKKIFLLVVRQRSKYKKEKILSMILQDPDVNYHPSLAPAAIIVTMTDKGEINKKNMSVIENRANNEGIDGVILVNCRSAKNHVEQFLGPDFIVKTVDFI